MTFCALFSGKGFMLIAFHQEIPDFRVTGKTYLLFRSCKVEGIFGYMRIMTDGATFVIDGLKNKFCFEIIIILMTSLAEFDLGIEDNSGEVGCMRIVTVHAFALIRYRMSVGRQPERFFLLVVTCITEFAVGCDDSERFSISTGIMTGDALTTV
jgi:hypothetical protein